MKVILGVPDESYSRNTSCPLNLTTTFSFQPNSIRFFSSILCYFILFVVLSPPLVHCNTDSLYSIMMN